MRGLGVWGLGFTGSGVQGFRGVGVRAYIMMLHRVALVAAGSWGSLKNSTATVLASNTIIRIGSSSVCNVGVGIITNSIPFGSL